MYLFISAFLYLSELACGASGLYSMNTILLHALMDSVSEARAPPCKRSEPAAVQVFANVFVTLSAKVLVKVFAKVFAKVFESVLCKHVKKQIHTCTFTCIYAKKTISNGWPTGLAAFHDASHTLITPMISLLSDWWLFQ